MIKQVCEYCTTVLESKENSRFCSEMCEEDHREDPECWCECGLEEVVR